VIDLDALEAAIAEGERKNLFVAPVVKTLIAELREARGERAAVVAWLRGRQEAAEWALTAAGYEHAADAIERGEHRRGEDK